jgi:hypothetical protein
MYKKIYRRHKEEKNAELLREIRLLMIHGRNKIHTNFSLISQKPATGVLPVSDIPFQYFWRGIKRSMAEYTIISTRRIHWCPLSPVYSIFSHWETPIPGGISYLIINVSPFSKGERMDIEAICQDHRYNTRFRFLLYMKDYNKMRTLKITGSTTLSNRRSWKSFFGGI